MENEMGAGACRKFIPVELGWGRAPSPQTQTAKLLTPMAVATEIDVIQVHIHMCMYMCLYMYIDVYINTYIYTRNYMDMCIYIYMH